MIIISKLYTLLSLPFYKSEKYLIKTYSEFLSKYSFIFTSTNNLTTDYISTIKYLFENLIVDEESMSKNIGKILMNWKTILIPHLNDLLQFILVYNIFI